MDDAFISYRRSDGSTVARWLRRALQTDRVPRSFPPLRDRRLVVYVDTAYERSAPAFYEHTIRPALLQSRHLIVLATPDAANARRGGTDWMWRELRDFRAAAQGDRIIVVRAAGPFSGELPAGLKDRFPNIELVDLRQAGPLAMLMSWRAARLNDELLKIAATLQDVDPHRMPDLRQEQERRQQRRLGAAAGLVAAFTIGALTAAVIVLRGEQRAVRALQDAIFATERVIVAADRALDPSPQPHDPRSRVLDEVCDLRTRILDDASGQGGWQERRICEAERVRGLMAQGETAQARDRALRLVEALRRGIDGTVAPMVAAQWLRGCDLLTAVAADAVPPAGWGDDEQARTIEAHRDAAIFRDGWVGRELGRSLDDRRIAAAAAERDDTAAAVRPWRAAVRHYRQALEAGASDDQAVRIRLDMAGLLIAIAAFEGSGQRVRESREALTSARALLDTTIGEGTRDPELTAHARRLDERWRRLRQDLGLR